MKIRLIAAAILSLSTMFAQDNTGLLPRPQPQWDELRQHLVLSEAQVTTLEQVYRSRQDAEQAIYRQIAEKQNQLNALLQDGSNDAATIGRLMVEINTLRRQLPLDGEPYRTQALAVLNDVQKGKLAPLADALKLQSPAWQAVQLNLIDSPRTPDVRILPIPVSQTVPAGQAEIVGNVR